MAPISPKVRSECCGGHKSPPSLGWCLPVPLLPHSPCSSTYWVLAGSSIWTSLPPRTPWGSSFFLHPNAGSPQAPQLGAAPLSLRLLPFYLQSAFLHLHGGELPTLLVLLLVSPQNITPSRVGICLSWPRCCHPSTCHSPVHSTCSVNTIASDHLLPWLSCVVSTGGEGVRDGGNPEREAPAFQAGEALRPKQSCYSARTAV